MEKDLSRTICADWPSLHFVTITLSKAVSPSDDTNLNLKYIVLMACHYLVNFIKNAYY